MGYGLWVMGYGLWVMGARLPVQGSGSECTAGQRRKRTLIPREPQPHLEVDYFFQFAQILSPLHPNPLAFDPYYTLNPKR
jgi:hypothetical protein